MCIERFIILIIILLGYANPASPQDQAAGSPVLSDEQQLLKARRANEEAQAEYYREQTSKLRVPAKSFKENLAENPATVLGVISAIAAALFTSLVGLFTLYVNHRAVIKSHYDTQFYEALKLFGDKNSNLRSSAAGILAHIAKIQLRDFEPSHPVSSFKKTQPYFGIAHSQLLVGFVSEKDEYSILQIRRSIHQLIPTNADGMAITLINANTRSRIQVIRALAGFFIANGATNADNISDELWEKVPQNVYEREVFFNLLKRDDKFYATFTRLLLEFQASCSDDNKKLKKQASALQELNFAAYRLFLMVGIHRAALAESPAVGTHEQILPLFLVRADLSKLDLTGANLQGAFLSGANLQEANLSKARMKQAWLDKADVTGAKLAGAEIDPSSMQNVKWWKANYYTDKDNKKVDTALLGGLHEKYKSEALENSDEVHSSVKDFIQSENSRCTLGQR